MKRNIKDEDECIELKNIQYKTMLLNGTSLVTPGSDSCQLSNIENLLEMERSRDQKDAWNKLDKTAKIKKLLLYIDYILNQQQILKSDKLRMSDQLIGYLDKKLLQRNKDVTYDKETGVIIDIPALEITSTPKRFTLKRSIKHNKNTLSRSSKIRKKNEKIDSNNND